MERERNREKDKRITFFVETVKSIAQCDRVIDTLVTEIEASKDIRLFLDDTSVLSVRVSVIHGDSFQVNSSVIYEDSIDVTFVKRTLDPISENNISHIIDVHSIQGSPLDGLYSSLKGIWSPILLNRADISNKIDPRVKTLLTELEGALGHLKHSFEVKDGNIDLEICTGIVEPVDEINFWIALCDNRQNAYREFAKGIRDILKKLGEFDSTETMNFDDLNIFISNIVDLLNSLWNFRSGDRVVYPQKRMTHFLTCLSGAISRQIQKNLSKVELWKGAYGHVRSELLLAVDVCKNWTNSIHELTLAWQSEEHVWNGTVFVDAFMVAFQIRLEEILKLRSLSEELLELLSHDDNDAYQISGFFSILEDAIPLYYNQYSQNKWARAVNEFKRAIDPVEIAVATKFKKQISSILDQPHLLLREFQKYKNLVERPSIRKALVSERETLLNHLKELFNKLENFVESIENLDVDNESQPTKLLSKKVRSIVQIRQCSARTTSVLAISHDLLSDLEGYLSFAKIGKEFLERLKSEEDLLFNHWVSHVKESIEDDSSIFKLQGSLMGFKDGILIVNFPEELVEFLREVRQLDDLGFALPKNPMGKGKRSIADVAQDASRSYRYGILLRKTANFYNSIGDQIIDVQENLLLASISKFTDLVSKPTSKEVTWSKPVECENYIRLLQDAAERLSSENRSLRKAHEYLCIQICQLMQVDLLRQTDVWKSKWRSIKDKMVSIRSHYSERDSRSWIVHWDHQQYKALEASYQLMLESLSEHLPEIRADLIFTNKRLEFKPPLENIRQAYYNEMKKYMAMPNSFEGFGNAVIYKKMGKSNIKRIIKVFQKAETLFSRIDNLITKYNPLVKLGQLPDLDQFIENHVKQTEEYITNFRSLKAKKRELDKLPDFEKIECCTVSLIPFKAALDDLYVKIGDGLLISLRRNILTEFKAVDQFLLKASDRLNTRPHTVDEITQAQKEWREFGDQKDSMKNLSRICVEKKKLLVTQAPGSSVDISEVMNKMSNLDGEGGRWDDFDIGMDAFNLMIEDQKEEARAILEEDVVKLNKEIDRLNHRWKQLKPGDVTTFDASTVNEVFKSLEEWKIEMDKIYEASIKLTDSCLSFDFPKPRFDGLDFLVDDLKNTNKSWDLLKEYLHELSQISGQDWVSFSANVYALQDFADGWFEKLKGSSAKDSTAIYILTTVDKIKKSIVTLKYCNGETFTETHWTELLQVKLQMSKDLNKRNVKVEHFLTKLDILNDPSTLTFVKNLQSRALGEVQIKTSMDELALWEKTAELAILTSEESGRKVSLIKEWKDLLLQLGDKQSLLASLKDSQFFASFAVQGEALENKLSSLVKSLDTLNLIQRKWVYLEPIFGRGALPSEEARFKRVDEEYIEIMQIIASEPRLFNLADSRIHPNLFERLRNILDQLERCQKALSDFLETKRQAMPRFYFIGDDDLLEILGQAKNPSVIQSHLKKLFQGINKVSMTPNFSHITAMISSAGEVVQLETPIQITERVEEWLEKLACEMRNTLASLLYSCLKSKSFDWKFPSQILCLAQQINFTEEVEIAIVNDDLDSLRKNLSTQLRKFTSIDFAGQVLEQLKMKSLVVDLVHNLDVVEQLIQKKVSRLVDWQWRKQLRYYFEENSVFVKMSAARFLYTFEYQGNAPKLVHTPLTDKCYLTLTQGMHMGFGGNPYGPAGTGKTESVKALASCMGRQVLVFNCDEGIDFQSMGRIFIGLIKCGAWGCFDEFNRLKEDQLSAISQQIQLIQDAIKAKTPSINLLGRNIDVNFNAGIFVTLNPAGKGYGGRSRLPDNLKALFRPVAMGVPDNEIIAEVNLVTEGFTKARDLASKIVSLFKLSKQLLSSQQHYDWGLRALKAVLNTGGRLIQSYKLQNVNVDATAEYEILIKAVRVNTLSKLTFNDTNKFLALIGDVFPGIPSADITGGELEAAIKEVMKLKPFYLVEDPSQIKKMIQLKESLDQRMGCVIVGPSGSGKSTLWRVLKAALVKCGQKVVSYVMNPKAMSRERLLGKMDLDTREWFDGVLTDAARQVVKEPADVNCWIICDGDIDPEWIESLNSVLDDNHLLTMPNGERISFGSNVNFLFETHDLSFASPATVSRMGMIFLSDEDLQVERIVQRWLSMLPNESRISISTWIDEMFYRSVDYIRRCDTVIDSTYVGTVINGLSQLRNVKTRQEFVCALIRGLGGNVSLTNKISFAKEVFNIASDRPPDLASPLDCDAHGNVYEQFHLSSDLSKTDISLLDIGDKAVIPTISVQRTMAMIKSWIDHCEPFILVGPEGCGKSMIINHAVRQRKNIGIATLNCNAQTTAEDVIRKISQTCSLYSSTEGRVYRPRDCERLILHLKDINLPRPDKYNTCQLIAFLQQLITFDGFYDENLEFLRFEKIQIVATINAATTVGRHPLSTRFTAIARIGVVDYPDTSELNTVYCTFLRAILSSTTLKDRRSLLDSEVLRLATFLVEIFQKVREKFTVDDARHYLFTPRDLTLWVKNTCRYDLSNEDLVDVIAHEACRIFRDRLVDSESCGRFDQILNSALRSHFKLSLNPADFLYSSLTSVRGNGGNTKKLEGKERVLDCGGKLHRMIEADLAKLVAQGLMYYEREERELSMLLVSEILEQVSRVDRVLSGANGHLLMVGRCGVGRRNAVTIAAYMLGYELRSLSISREYSNKVFNENIKEVLTVAGISGLNVVLLVEDYQIVSEYILEVINSLLSSGEVPGLYSHEELEPLLSQLREEMREDGRHRTLYDFFISRIKRNLHIVILMDSRNPKMMYRCESNPALYSQCAVLWIGDWKNTTLRTIPKLMEGIKDLLDDGSLEDSKFQDTKWRNRNEAKEGREGKDYDADEAKSIRSDSNEKLIQMIFSIHKSCESEGATPRDYVAFLKAWHLLCTATKDDLKKQYDNLEAGLSKLESAAEIVHDLKTNAVNQEKELTIAQEAASKALRDIGNAFTSANERRNEVEEIKRKVSENEIKAQAHKAQIEAELANIQPILESAKAAVGNIRAEHLSEIKSMNAPPEAVADVLQAVLVMLGIEDLSWNSMKRFIGNRGVKEEILNFDTRRLTHELRSRVGKLLKSKASSFEDANIQRVSMAAAPMAAWVKANIRYSIVLEKIEPLQQELEEEIEKLRVSQHHLQKCEEELNSLDMRVAKLQNDFENRTAETARLKNNLNIAATTLVKAEKLINQLSGEQSRWKSQSVQLRDDIAKIPVKMLLAAGFMTYLAKAPEDSRSNKLNIWQEITGVSGFSFKRVMSTESQLLQWKSLGLPADDLSQENGLVIVKTLDRVPFIIDPASVATEWLKSVLSNDKSRPLEVVIHHDTRFTNQVELAVRFGKSLLILEVDGVEPMLYPLCRKDLTHQGPRYVVKLGDKSIDYNEAFRLFLVTRNPQPDLPPDAAAIVSQVNFTVTRSGLEGQLLGLSIQHEKPELEKQKGELLQHEESFKVQLYNLERDLLLALATAEGNLLENNSLIESLTATKVKAAEIEDALERSAQTSKVLDEQREVYRPFAHNGSKIFFLIKSLKAISHMYQFSLASFLTLFKEALTAKMSAATVEERLRLLCQDIEVRTLHFVGRALFKEDRPMLGLHLIRAMHPDQFQPKEWEIFTGTLVSTIQDAVPKGFPSWAPNERVASFRVLAEQLPNLVNSCEFDNVKWQRFAGSPEAETDFPPLKGVSNFQKVLLIQTLRPDRLQSSILHFCCELLKVKSLSPPPLSLSALFSESEPSAPILLISSTGADPSKEIQEFAAKTIGATQYEELAMGGGQQEVAMNLVREAAKEGYWVCLKNLHLVVAWLPTLEKELSSLNPHPDFRLWLTTESHPAFPTILLQESLKATYESPPGVKKNLQRTFEWWGFETFEKIKPLHARLLFLLACFHAVMQERRTYIPQGWTKFYEFSYGDLKAGSYMIEAISEEYEKSGVLDWDAIYGLMEDAIYGGRVDNAYDMRVLRAYLRSFFADRIAMDYGAGREILAKTPLRMPNTTDYDSFIRIIEQLFDQDPPYIFGLPDNIERSLQRFTSTAVIKQLRALSLTESETSKFDREKWRAELGPIIDLWSQIVSSNNLFQSKNLKASNNAGSSGNPLDDFVSMENKLAVDICFQVDQTLSALKKVLFGSGLLTPAIQSVASDLMKGVTPSDWRDKWDGPDKPQTWLTVLGQKKISLQKWMTCSSKGTLLDEPVSLGDLFNPATFVNALRQQSARLLGLAIDRVKMICSWESKKEASAAFAKVGQCPLLCQISSLLLQGASFQQGGKVLRDASSDASELTLAPMVVIGFISVESTNEPYGNQATMPIPLYFNPAREELLTELQMPIDDEDKSKWVLAGVSLFLTDNE